LWGDAVTGVRLMRVGLEGLPNARHQVFYSVFLGGLAKWVVAAGVEGLGMIGEAVEPAERSDEAWYLTELLRIKGESQRAGSAPNTGDAEQQFLRSLHLAHRQGALSWELRAATSLARLYRDDSRQEEARNMLAPVFSRFTEGSGTADFSKAERVLQQLT
jgi:predicted ATPase